MKRLLFFLLLVSLRSFAQNDTLIVVGDSLTTKGIILPDSSEAAKKPFDTTRGARFKRVLKGTSSTFLKVVGIDSVSQRERPKIIFLRSMIVPSSGQIMNKDYWKAPLVYVGAAGGIYAIWMNNSYYKYYLSHVEFLEENKQESMTPYPYRGKSMGSNSISKQTYARAAASFKRNRDFAWIGFGLGWTLFAVEANVAAHLKNFDISDDISFKVQPTFMSPMSGSIAPGVKLSVNFK